eukprot:361399-Chlamydomonas_euryale.AAC.11
MWHNPGGDLAKAWRRVMAVARRADHHSAAHGVWPYAGSAGPGARGVRGRGAGVSAQDGGHAGAVHADAAGDAGQDAREAGKAHRSVTSCTSSRQSASRRDVVHKKLAKRVEA